MYWKCHIRALDSFYPPVDFTFAFEFVIFSHVLQENIFVCFAYIYSPFTFYN